MDVSIVLPVHNERANILPEISRIRQAMDASEYSYEIVVIDDGSTDGSAEVLASIPGIRFVRSTENRGSGFARRIGTQHAHGRIVVWTDVDMSYPNDRIPELVKTTNGKDHVVGARTSEEGTLKWLRVPAKWFIRKLAEFLTATQIPDLNSGFRAFRRDVAAQYLHLLPNGFSCVTTLTMAFLNNGYSVDYIPIDYRPRAGRSKFHPVRDAQRYVLQVVRMTMLYNPLRVFLPLGSTVLLAGIGKLVYDMVTKDLRIATNTLVLLGAAIAIVVIGLLADLTVQLLRQRDPVDPAFLSEEGPAVTEVGDWA